jgi:O-antigen/teichoic acid export membrane protein
VTRGRHVFRSTVGNTFAKLASLALWFLISPFLLRGLGAEAFAARFLLASLASFSALFDYAISTAIVRDVAAARARASPREDGPLVATAWAACVGYAALLAVAALALAPLLSRWIAGGALTRAAATHLVWLTAVEAIVMLAFMATTAVLRGLQRFDLANVSTLLVGVLTAGAAVASLALGGDVRGMVAATSAAMALVVVVNLRLVRRAEPGWRVSWRDARWTLLAPIRRYASPIYVASLANQIQTRTGEILVAALLPVGAVTPFHLARRLGEVPSIFSEQFLRVLLPLASELEASGDGARLRELYLTGTRISLALLLSTGCLLGACAGPLLALWIGAEFARFAPVVVALVAMMVVQSSQAIAATVLQGMNRHRPLALIAVTSGGASIALSFLLVPRLGLLGVSIALLVPTALAAFLGVVPYASKTLEVRSTELLARAAWPAAAPLAPMLAVVWLLREGLGDGSWPRLALVGGAGLLVYGAIYLRFGVGALERRLVRSAFTS